MGRQGYARIWLGTTLVDPRDVPGLGDPTSIRITRDRRKPSEAKVVWEVVRADIDDEELLDENVIVRILLGYVGGDTFEQTYRIRNVEVEQSSKGTMLTLTCKDETVGLADIVWHDVRSNIRASDLAIEAARLMGLRADVQRSDVVYPTVSFAGSTIGQVLSELADDEDFEFGIVKDTLRFRRVNRDEKASGLDYRFIWAGSGKTSRGGQVIDFKFKTDVRSKVARDKREIQGKDEAEARNRYTVEGTAGEIEENVTIIYLPSGETRVERSVEPKMNRAAFEQYGAFLAEVAPDAEDVQQLPLAQRAEDGTYFPVNDQGIYELGRRAMIDAEKRKNDRAKELEQRKTQITRDEYVEEKAAIAKDFIAEVDTARQNLAGNLQRRYDQTAKQTRGRINSRIIEQSPIKDPTYLKRRNTAKVSKAKWRKRSAKVTLVGVLPQFGERFVIDGSSTNRRGPWLIRKATFEWSKGDLMVAVECKSPKPKKKNKGAGIGAGEEASGISVPVWIPAEWKDMTTIVYDENSKAEVEVTTRELVTPARIEFQPYEQASAVDLAISAQTALNPAVGFFLSETLNTENAQRAVAGTKKLVDTVKKRNAAKAKVPK